MLLYIFLTLLSYIYEKVSIKCKKISLKTESLSIMHHFLATYIYFGSFLFGNYSFHLIFNLIVMLWRGVMNRNGITENCPFSEAYNRMCGFKDHQEFRDLGHFLVHGLNIGLKYTILKTIIISYNLYHILN